VEQCGKIRTLKTGEANKKYTSALEKRTSINDLAAVSCEVKA
jgi:hypothetical protein